MGNVIFIQGLLPDEMERSFRGTSEALLCFVMSLRLRYNNSFELNNSMIIFYLMFLENMLIFLGVAFKR